MFAERTLQVAEPMNRPNTIRALLVRLLRARLGSSAVDAADPTLLPSKLLVAALVTLGTQAVSLTISTGLVAIIVRQSSDNGCSETTRGGSLTGFVCEAVCESPAFFAALAGLWLAAGVVTWPSLRAATRTLSGQRRAWRVILATLVAMLAIVVVANLILMNHCTTTLEQWRTVWGTPTSYLAGFPSAWEYAPIALPAAVLVLLTLGRCRAPGRWATTALLAAPAIVLPVYMARLESHQCNCFIYWGHFRDVLLPLAIVLLLAPPALATVAAYHARRGSRAN